PPSAASRGRARTSRPARTASPSAQHSTNAAARSSADFTPRPLTRSARPPGQMRTTGAGGVFASAEALARWGEAWFAGRIVGPAVVQRALSEGPTVADPPLDGSTRSGWGWFVTEREEGTVIWHDGARGGFRAALLHDPGAGLVVAVAANLADLDALGLAVEVAERLGDEATVHSGRSRPGNGAPRPPVEPIRGRVAEFDARS
ncbi:MAG: serine hydrolase, partial [Gemmatimonadota bacterium]|nr:serine hydrolase [Gemmatimonadota bacterium]